MLIAVLHERRPWTAFAANRQQPFTFLIFEMRMNIRKEHVADPLAYQIDEMQPHLVLIRKRIR
ncbi:hypothetical protein ATE59_14470 [Sphingopyxis sp. A083]|nr:hypothetical protein ATE59_14470 [Sphingopyxis sp. A083]